jgi:hypothetical protein
MPKCYLCEAELVSGNYCGADCPGKPSADEIAESETAWREYVSGEDKGLTLDEAIRDA